MSDIAETVELTAAIASAYVAHNPVPAGDLPALIQSIHQALATIETPAPVVEPLKAPAVSVKKSVGEDFLICLEDGLKFRSLKRHLRTKFGLTPEDYRAKWGLPKDYPMVAPAYAAARSSLARQMGLGQRGRMPAKAQPAATHGRAAKAAPAATSAQAVSEDAVTLQAAAPVAAAPAASAPIVAAPIAAAPGGARAKAAD